MQPIHEKSGKKGVQTSKLPLARQLFLGTSLAVLFVILLSEATAQTIRYVKITGNDASAGTSWGTAYRTVRKALDVAVAGDQVWVGTGTYYPDEGPGATNDAVDMFWTLKTNVALFGGFSGSETNIGQRNVITFPTYLDGNISQDGTAWNNAYQLLVGINAFEQNIDGFVLQNSYNSNPFNGQSGAIRFSAGYGYLRNCIFRNNYSIYAACIQLFGGITVSNCVFENNRASQGGVVYCGNNSFTSSTATFYNCIFRDNIADEYGGGIIFFGQSLVLEHCLFVDNKAPYGSELIASMATVTLKNTIFFLQGDQSGVSLQDNATMFFDHCIVDFGFNNDPAAVARNFVIDPQFVDSANGNYRLTMCSFGINRGLPASAENTTELDGNPRLKFDLPDIGPYEYQGPINPSIYYVKQGGAGNWTGRNWASAVPTLQDAITYSQSCNAMKEIWVAGGSYYPDEGFGYTKGHRGVAFIGRNQLAIYGGFAGTESLLSERNLSLTANQSILSGEIQQDANQGNNSYSVFRAQILDTSFLLDGFTIQGGNGTEIFLEDASKGAGIYMANQARPVIRNCTIKNNNAIFGAAIYNKNASPTYINCVITQNNSQLSNGTIWNDTSNARYINCSVGGNSVFGGDKTVMRNTGPSSPVIYNSIITGDNSAVAGGTPQITYSLLQGDAVVAGIGNNNGNPHFENAAAGDLRITTCSWGVNRANATGAPALDILGKPRNVGGKYDMGAYELQTIDQLEARIYVRAAAAGTNNGKSWTNAYTKLGDGLAKAKDCGFENEIWVAGGTYYPDEGGGAQDNARNSRFSSRSNLSIYGGFAGTETLLSQRNLNAGNASILSGEIQQDNNQGNNAVHVVVIESANSSLLFDGFTISDGFANGVIPEEDGRGAGVYISAGSECAIRNCTITRNIANRGSAIYAAGASSLIVNCKIEGNSTAFSNGAIWVDNSSPSFFHCSVANNPITGGSDFIVMRNTGTASPVITNCIFRGTSPSIAGGTPSISYSIIQNPSVWPGTGNSNADPLFVSEGTGNLQLSLCSPAINNGLLLFLVTKDILDFPRPTLGKVDIGAYEYQQSAATNRLYVKANAAGANNGSSWANAYNKLNDAINRAKLCGGITEIWVSSGNYYPDEGAGLVNNDRTTNFGGRNYLSIYGGFAGTETLLSQRVLNWNSPSILTGNLQQDAVGNNNSYNVILLSNIDSTFVLDGFVIRDGNAELLDGTNKSFGGGLAILGGNPGIQNCLIVRNTASLGSAVASVASRAGFTNCVITNNHTLTSGTMYNVDGAPRLLHTSIANNSFAGGDLTIINNLGTAKPVITNSIVRGSNTAISGTATVTYSLIQGAAVYTGTGNINSDPLFLDEANGDLRLLPCSPAINAGIAAGVLLDVQGVTRPTGGGYDMGAYERASIQTIYVNALAPANGDGSSWANAFNSLQDALQVNCSVPIWVAKGTYKPTAGTDRNISFAMKNNLAIYGGFAGTETLLSQRGVLTNPTILSGDIGIASNSSDNSYHVFSNANLNATAILDGFTVTGGNAADIGGGMYNNNASPTIRNCIFRNNNSASWAGAVYCAAASNAQFTNCLFTGNTAAIGGGFFNNSSSPVFVNCTMTGNSSPQGSFAWGQTNSLANLTNCIVWGNTGSAALANTVTSPYTVSYSITQEVVAGTGNLVANPQFADTSDANYTLLSCSPALNAGSNAALPAGTTLDLASRQRVFGASVDMGVHERQTNPGQTLIYVDGTATGNGDGTAWQHAFPKILPALNEMNNCNNAVSLSMAMGTYVTPVFLINRAGVEIWGGYPIGGGALNPVLNPTIWKGSVQVLKSAKMNGVKLQQ